MKDKRGNKQYLEYGEQTIRLFPELYSAKEGPNGERVMARTVTFQVTDDCNLACKYCVSAGTKVLLDNYDLKNIEDIKVEDSVLGFEENVSGYYRNKVMKAKVLNTFHRKSKVLEIETENGLKLNITDNHKILSSPKKTFIEAGKLKVGDKIYYHPLIDLANKKNLSESINYKIGYITGIFKGDGSIKNYTRRSDNAQVYKTRLAVKDKEIIQRTKRYLDDLDFNTYLKPFMTSKKYNLKEDAIFSNRKDTYFNLLKLFENNFKKNINEDYCRGFLAGIYDAEGSFCKSRFLRICNTDKDIIDEIIRCLNKFSIEYVLEENGKTKNKEHKWNIRIDAKTDSKNSFNFLNIINSALPRKSFEGFLDYAPLKTLEIKNIKELPDEIDVYNLETETGTYIANGIAVHNCYQCNKGKRRMSFETAKKFVDYLLDADESNHYINPTISPFIIIDFIGGEPFLEIDLIEKIVNYFNDQCFLRQHPWATRHRFSICSNGVLYFDPRVQEFMHKNRGNISFSVTIDGNKELHDSCRVFPDGSPSYDLAVAAAQDWMNQGNYMGSKITIAPGNVQYLSGALKHMIELGYTEINANCVYEEGWELEHAQELYKQMKIFSDYLIENNLYRDIFCSLYQENFFQPKDPRDNQNWCFGAGTPILTTDGYKPIEKVKIGDMVYTEDGTIHPVINTMSHFADNVVKTKISGAFDIVCTDNHNFYTLPFDYIGNKGIKYYKSYTKKELKDIKHNDLLKLFTLPERNKSFDKRLAYIVGRFIGDGWKIKDKEQYFICCSKKEKEFLINKLEEANIEYSLFSNKTVEEFRILNSNKELIELLKDCGYKADGKHIPKEGFLWDNESLSSLIEGYIDSDGYKNKRGQYRINTVSYQLAQEIMLILRTLGFTPTCYINNRKGKSMIEGRKVSIKNRYEIYFYDNPERSKYVHKKDDEMWTYGLKLKKDIPQIVYNLTIEGNHSYIAGGFAVSNCGGTGLMLACDPDGWIYPCLRYMESSLGDDQPPLRIGHVDRGIETLDSEKEIIKCLDCITRRSQSTDECFYCPIAEGCSWCSAYNYQVFGTADARATFICIMHRARALGNLYYFNKIHIKENEDDRMLCYVPKEWAIPIIGEEEFSKLIEDSGGRLGINPFDEEFRKAQKERESN